MPGDPEIVSAQARTRLIRRVLIRRRIPHSIRRDAQRKVTIITTFEAAHELSIIRIMAIAFPCQGEPGGQFVVRVGKDPYA